MSRCIRRRRKCARRSRSSPTRRSAAAPLVLDGDGLTLVVAQARRHRAAAGQLRRDARQPDHSAAAEPAVHAGDRDAGRSDRQHPALRALPVERHLLHAMRGRRLPPHHLFSRPARRDGGLHHAHRGRQNGSAGAAVERQSDRERRSARRPAFRGLARSASQAVLSVRAGRRQSRRASRTASAPCPGATSRCASMSSPARRTAAATPWIRSSAPCAGTRRRSAANTISIFS